MIAVLRFGAPILAIVAATFAVAVTTPAAAADATRWIQGEPDPWSYDRVAWGSVSHFRVERAGGWTILVPPEREVVEKVERLHVFSREGRGRRTLLEWKTPEGARLARALSTGHGPEFADGTVRHTFPVEFEPTWAGSRATFRLLDAEQGIPYPVERVTGERRRDDPEVTAALSGRTGRIDVLGDTRPALFGLPGRALEWTTAVPEGGELSVAIGRPPGTAIPVRIVVEVRPQPKAESRVLVRRVLDPVDPRRPRPWTDLRIPLFGIRGDRVVFRFLVESDEAANPLSGFVAWGDPTVEAPRADGPPNVALIVVDTLRRDRVSAYGVRTGTTPHIDRWAARNSVLFEDAMASSPWTVPSHLSLFTGLDPISHGGNWGRPSAPYASWLPRQLRLAGYTTAAFTGGGYLTPEYGFARGFDRFRAWSGNRAVPAPSELEENLAEALAWLRQAHDRPFFLFFHTYETHSPHEPRAPYYSRLTGREDSPPALWATTDPAVAEDGYRARKRFVPREETGPEATAEALESLDAIYDSEVAYTDERLAPLLAELDRLGAMVVLTSDHGEALGEKGFYGHATLHEFDLAIPLVIAWPDRRNAGQRSKVPAGLPDLMPTILREAGITAAEGLDGTALQSLEETDGPRYRVASGNSTSAGLATRTRDGRKYILGLSAWPPLRGERQVYDLRRDPTESRNLAGTQHREAAPVFRRLEEAYLRRGDHTRVDWEGDWTGEVVELGSDWASPHRWKALGHGPLDLELLGGMLRWSPNDSFEGGLFLDGAPAGPLRLHISSGGTTTTFELSVDQLSGGEEIRVGRTATGWSLGPSSSESAALILRRSGASSGEPRPAPAPSEELRQLGYVP